jgi:hypothetical protein
MLTSYSEVIMISENKHRVFLNDLGIIEYVWEGDGNWKQYMELQQESAKIASDLESKGLPIKMIVDFTRLGSFVGEEITSVGKRSLADIPYTKCAGYGIQPRHQTILDVIKEETRSNPGIIKDFPTREAALQWLEADDE